MRKQILRGKEALGKVGAQVVEGGEHRLGHAGRGRVGGQDRRAHCWMLRGGRIGRRGGGKRRRGGRRGRRRRASPRRAAALSGLT
ncbi:hypothetical protein DAEQUDRAFT_100594 [Daedalea quercina L-15889]|uniref:Uncharacterized protein n=1 Tax=Daedalea quercina L-15889 TaxID=1314783 RepID=A0A165KWM7_9APHY|nr:hypothetical protein DAEQUDRAFT_100594 [Daedalea quercina L-15889]